MPEFAFQILNNMQEAVFVRDRNMHILYMNPAAEKMSGLRFEGAGRMICRDVFCSSESSCRLRSSILQAEGYGDRSAQCELRIRNHCGRVYEVIASAVPLEGGEEGSWMIFLRDVTEHKMLEAAFKDRQREHDEVQSIARLGHWELDLISGCLTWSDEIYRIFGLEQDEFEFTMDAFVERIHPDDRERVMDAYFDSLNSGERYRIEHRIIRPDGTIADVLEQGETLYDEEGKPVRSMGTVQDVTERKMTENALSEALSRAEAADRAKGEFLANMSHEIRTPLNGILGMLQLMQTTVLDTEQDEYILNAIQSARRLTGLLTGILNFSRIQSDQLSLQTNPFDIGKVMHDVRHLFQVEADQFDTKLKVLVHEGLEKTLLGDEVRLQQILSNLVGNGVKFTPGGRVVAEVSPLPQTISGKRNVLFSVSDTGRGIPEADISRLFTPFSRVGSRHDGGSQGAGLGLSACLRLVRMMGGNMAVDSTPGSGTTVYFTAVFGVPKQPDLTESAQLNSAGGLKPGVRVLLAEDDRISSRVVQCRIEKAGGFVRAVENGVEALEALRQEMFDVVLMDIQMPVMNGVEATRAIRRGEAGQDRKDIPIIAVTAFALAGAQVGAGIVDSSEDSSEDRSEDRSGDRSGNQAGDRVGPQGAEMDAYAAKPVEMDALQETINRLVGRS